MYTKAKLVEQIFLKVSGGKLSRDLAVERVDIHPYVSSAISYVLIKEYRVREKEARQDQFGSSGLSEEFLSTVKLKVQFDDQRHLKFCEIPFKIVSLPRNRGIHSASPLNGADQYIKTVRFETKGLEDELSFVTTFWYERVNDKSILFWRNLPDTTEEVLLYAVKDFSSYADDEVLQLPAGVDLEVIQLAEQFFTGQKSIPEDIKLDGNEQV